MMVEWPFPAAGCVACCARWWHSATAQSPNAHMKYEDKNDTTVNEQCGGWAAPLREQQHRRMESLTVPNCTWREGLWVRHGRAGDGHVSALPAPASPCAAVGVGGDGGALVQPPQPLRVEQCPWMILPLSRAEACHEYSSTTAVESGREFES